MKSRTGDEILRAFTKIYQKLKSSGLAPKIHRIDNKCPATLKAFIKSENIEYRLVLPHIHRRNTAEKAISTFKGHLIAGLSSMDPNIPMHLWCRLLPQAFLTLNIMRQSSINPNLSAYAQIEGVHDYNAHPIAQPLIEILIHEKKTSGKYGHHMEWKIFAWVLHLNITDVIECMQPRQGDKG